MKCFLCTCGANHEACIHYSLTNFHMLKDCCMPAVNPTWSGWVIFLKYCWFQLDSICHGFLHLYWLAKLVISSLSLLCLFFLILEPSGNFWLSFNIIESYLHKFIMGVSVLLWWVHHLLLLCCFMLGMYLFLQRKILIIKYKDNISKI